MCKAKKHIAELMNVIEKIDRDYQEVCEEVRRYDLMEQDVLHRIEDIKFNAAEGYEFSRQIQIIRQARRKVKNEHATLTQLRATIGNAFKALNTVGETIDKTEEKLQKSKYHPRILKTESDLKLVVSN